MGHSSQKNRLAILCLLIKETRLDYRVQKSEDTACKNIPLLLLHREANIQSHWDHFHVDRIPSGYYRVPLG